MYYIGVPAECQDVVFERVILQKSEMCFGDVYYNSNFCRVCVSHIATGRDMSAGDDGMIKL